MVSHDQHLLSLSSKTVVINFIFVYSLGQEQDSRNSTVEFSRIHLERATEVAWRESKNNTDSWHFHNKTNLKFLHNFFLQWFWYPGKSWEVKDTFWKWWLILRGIMIVFIKIGVIKLSIKLIKRKMSQPLSKISN